MTSKPPIKNRQDIALLVQTFYTKVRADEVLGPIFNGIVKDWDDHLVLLTDFWEAQLLLVRKYQGNPIKAHQEVDVKTDYTIAPEHFGLWLNLWFQTLDELFEGDIAWTARNRAQKMSTMLFLEMYKNRTPKDSQ